MNCALSTRPSLNAVMSPSTGCYKPFLVQYCTVVLQQRGDNATLIIFISTTTTTTCRPENSHKGKSAVHQADLNVLYCCNEEARVSLSDVYGKCQVIYMEESLDSRSKLDEYFRGGPDRFYFTEARSHFIL